MIKFTVNKIVLLIFCVLILNCTNRFITPYPQPFKSKSSPKKTLSKVYVHNEKNAVDNDTVDFGSVLDSDNTNGILLKEEDVVNRQHKTFSIRNPPFKIDRPFVRVLLKKNLTSVSFYSIGNVEILPLKGKVVTFRGRCLAKIINSSELKLEFALGGMNVQLPCTLQSKNEFNLIDVEKSSFRGALILSSGKKGSFSIINSINIEEYLRGVVPLEIGKLSEDAIEALKAQAIAARTYTYQRIHEQAASPFDLFSTTADQVYGGAKVEYREADLAIRLTKNLILIYNDSIARAYYHSTCGGQTANIEDVWPNKKPPQPYLHSESDRDPAGVPYCVNSKFFKWEEVWTKGMFSQCVCQSLRRIDLRGNYSGLISGMRIMEMFDCGRVKECKIYGRGWTYDCGGDLIRTIFRRPLAGEPILRSANFTISDFDANRVRISGTGYGHGVGMCQTGAIARARRGQTYEAILRAYYRGIVIHTAIQP